ncbi:hypothetical protein SKAU_G00233570 [Synaphobranchus kaupii]|uniref:ribonuclease H n=1 Tax=Synaphobranchus kaupii TaxID=118154 RepID=A0A9Q1ITL5_SYNKA|nr:hypothetical protein SKAU_G00233570 [Synaphobranchus kaupii]
MPKAKVSSIIDAKCGFWQIPLSEESSKLTTFMTPVGRYTFLRMPYGISTGSEVVQRCYSEVTAPLHQLLHQDMDWSWQEHHTAAFTKPKELITSPPVLQCTSQSCCLQTPKIERELLALVYACHKFHDYLWPACDWSSS